MRFDSSNSTAGSLSIHFVAVVALFVTCLIISNILAVKLISLGGLILPAGMVLFPLSYILADVLTEVYGYPRMRQVIWLGFFCNLLAVAAIAIGGALPPAYFWKDQAAFDAILGATPRILAASFAAYLCGEFANAHVLTRLKAATQGRHLWLRTIGSTLIGQAIDSAIFITIAFAGILPPTVMVTAIVTQWLAKSAYEALATPATYAAVAFLKRREGLETAGNGPALQHRGT